MRILVTGGAGFIGSHVVDAYLAQGHEVAVLDSLETGAMENLAPDATFFEADIRDAEAVDAIFEEFRPEAVSHHAAQISVPHSVQDPAFDANANIVGSLNVWKAAREVGARRLIFSSSGGAIYGPALDLPISETQTPAPMSPYGLSKQVFEMYLKQLRAFDGPTPVMLRYANVYGPRQGARGEAGVVSIFARRLMEGLPCTIYGDGSSTRDYVFVGDLVKANVLALTKGDGEAINIASQTQTSALELFRLIHELVGPGPGPGEPMFAPEREGDVRFSCLDASKAKRMLGWEPLTTLRDGLKQVVESIRVPSRT